MTSREPRTGREKLPHKPGPKSRLTDELIEEVIQLIAAGNYIEVACAAVGIYRSTYTAWLARGHATAELLSTLRREDEDPIDIDDEKPEHLDPLDWQCFKLARRAEKAQAQAEAYAVTIVRKHFPDQWTAAMTYLERRFPDRWKRRDAREMTGRVEHISGVDEDALLEDPEAVELIHEALEKSQLPSGDGA